jgi:type I restriction enzyme S subunit
MQSKQALVPKLRFGGYEDKWKERELQTQGILVSGLTYSPTDIADKGLLVLRSSNVQEGQLAFEDCVYVDLDVPEKNYSREGDILICVRNGSKRLIGKNAIIPSNCPTATHGAFMTIFRSENYGFVFQLLQTDVYKWNVHRNLGATINSINGNDLKRFKFQIPSLPEQEKIAAFLTSVDDRIDQLKRKKSLLQDYKKGAMQKLFSQELRFKNEQGKDFPDWEVKKLGDVCELVTGLTYSPTDISDTGLLVLRSSNVQDGKVVFNDNVFVTSEVKEWNLSQPNDILICVRNGSKRLIGKNALVPENCPLATHGAFMSVLRGNQNLFIYQLLQGDVYKRNVHINLGATINSINGNDLKKFKFVFPSIPEQTKIANFLSSLDQKIEQVDTQITQTQTFKKGLLQQMFV